MLPARGENYPQMVLMLTLKKSYKSSLSPENEEVRKIFEIFLGHEGAKVRGLTQHPHNYQLTISFLFFSAFTFTADDLFQFLLKLSHVNPIFLLLKGTLYGTLQENSFGIFRTRSINEGF